jgi:hypothetical protein
MNKAYAILVLALCLIGIGYPSILCAASDPDAEWDLVMLVRDPFRDAFLVGANVSGTAARWPANGTVAWNDDTLNEVAAVLDPLAGALVALNFSFNDLVPDNNASVCHFPLDPAQPPGCAAAPYAVFAGSTMQGSPVALAFDAARNRTLGLVLFEVSLLNMSVGLVELRTAPDGNRSFELLHVFAAPGNPFGESLFELFSLGVVGDYAYAVAHGNLFYVRAVQIPLKNASAAVAFSISTGHDPFFAIVAPAADRAFIVVGDTSEVPSFFEALPPPAAAPLGPPTVYRIPMDSVANLSSLFLQPISQIFVAQFASETVLVIPQCHALNMLVLDPPTYLMLPLQQYGDCGSVVSSALLQTSFSYPLVPPSPPPPPPVSTTSAEALTTTSGIPTGTFTTSSSSGGGGGDGDHDNDVDDLSDADITVIIVVGSVLLLVLFLFAVGVALTAVALVYLSRRRRLGAPGEENALLSLRG